MKVAVMALVLALVLVTTSAGCGATSSKTGGEGPTEAAGPTTASKRFLMRLHAESLGPRKIRVRGVTNLPDGAVIQMSISRAFRMTRESEVRAVSVGRKPVTVSQGHFAALLRLDEKTLLIGLDEPSLGRIGVVDNAVTACADFETGRDLDGNQDQPDPKVREIVGPSGERLKGSPQVTVFGAATPTPSKWLEVTSRVPMNSPLVGRIANAQGTRPKSARLDGFCLS
jgi:hypothetical protein